MIRIANGQGFWGDSVDAPLEQIRRGPIDYLGLDYLAEVTMSILQKQRAKDPRAGYARDFAGFIESGGREIVERGVRVVANAGGVNLEACRAAVGDAFRRAGVSRRVRIGVVTGDDILPRLDELFASGVELRNLDTGEPIRTIRDRIQSANVYLGAFPIAEALDQGAQVVVTGRCSDAALALGPMIHEFRWKRDDWDLLAAGTVAGHIIECGAQCTGGNCQFDWENVPRLEDVGYPLAEVEADGSFVITKHPGTGGWVNIPSVAEQLLYEIGDPRAYMTPDCVADFTTVQLSEDGPDRVRAAGVWGRPATEFYKASISYSAGFKATGTLVYGWPDAYKKAQAADRILRARLDRLDLKFDAIRTEFVGVNAIHEGLSGEPSPDLAEVMLRVAVRAMEKPPLERFAKEIAPLVLNGPPVVTGYLGGRPRVEEIVAYWPALLPKSAVQVRVSVEEV